MVEELDAVVSAVRHDDVAVFIDGDPRRPVELAVASARTTERHQESALGVELLDAVVAPVGDVDCAVAIDGDAPGHVELARRRAVRTPLCNELAVLRELLHAVVVRIHDVEVLVRIESQARGAIELARFIAQRAECVQQFAMACECGNRVGAFVGNVEVFGAVTNNADRPGERAVDGAQVLVIEVHLADVRAVLGTTDDIQSAFVAEREVGCERSHTAHAVGGDVRVSRPEKCERWHRCYPSLFVSRGPAKSLRARGTGGSVRTARQQSAPHPAPAIARSRCHKCHGSRSCGGGLHR